MSRRSYEDFDLILSPTPDFDGSGAISVLGPTAATPFGSMRLEDAAEVHLDPLDFWDDPSTGIGGPVGALTHNPTSLIDADLEEMGRRLGDLAAPPGAVRELLRAALDWAASGRDRGLRLRLRLEAPILDALPWEYLLFDHPPYHPFLAKNAGVSIARTRSMEASEYARVTTRSSIVFAGVLSPTTGARQLTVDADFDAAVGAIDSLGSSVVQQRWFGGSNGRARWPEISEALLDGADIFHFVGHGDFDAGTGSLVFEQDDGGEDPIDAETVGVQLRNIGVRLAILGACESSRSTPDNPWTGVATTLTRLGLPAVIGNQAPIRSDSARILASRVFLRTLSHHAVDQAVAEARSLIAAERRLGVDWGIPVLYLDNGNGVVFPEAEDALAEARSKLAAADPREVAERALRHSPYRGVRPFTADHSWAFFGRDAEIEAALDVTTPGSVAWVVGPPGSGKTSLLEAGLVARWEGPVVRIENRSHLDDLDELPPTTEGQPGLVVVDPINAILDTDPPERDEIVARLRDLISDLPEHYTAVVAGREDEAPAVTSLRNALGHRLRPVRVGYLDRHQAMAAIVGPAERRSVEFDHDLATRVIDDLLDGGRTELIDPTELQIVVESMYQSARTRAVDPDEPIRVERTDYLGARVHVASYLEDQLETYFLDDKDEATSILENLAQRRSTDWSTPDDLGLEGSRTTLERLVERGFLIRRRRTRSEFAFARPAVAAVVERWVDPQVRIVRLAHQMIDGVTAGWDLDKSVAPAATVEALQAMADRLELEPDEVMLMLRSALATNKEPERWFHLAKAVAADRIGPLETGADSPTIDPALVGLSRTVDPRAGELSASAVTSEDPVDRHAAALAVATMRNSDQLLESSLRAHLDGRDLRMRRAELWATVTDADPSVTPPTTDFIDAALVRLVRGWRRLQRSFGDIGGRALAAGLGAGLALATYRAIVCGFRCPPSFVGYPAGVQFGTNLAWGGLIVMITMFLAGAATAIARRPGIRPLAAATIGFGTALSLVGFIGGLTFGETPLVVPASFVVGGAVAWGLTQKRDSVVVTLGIVAAVWAAAQLTLTMTGGAFCEFPNCARAAAFPVVQNALFFASDRDVIGVLPIAAAALDAAVVGILLVGGGHLGLRIRSRARREKEVFTS